MPDIKTRSSMKETIKVIDKAAVAGERMKKTFVRTKDKTRDSARSTECMPEEYAVDQVVSAGQSAGYEAAHQFNQQGRKGFQASKENISRAKERLRPKKINEAVEGGKQAIQMESKWGKKPIEMARGGAVKTAPRKMNTSEAAVGSKRRIKTAEVMRKGAVTSVQASGKPSQRAMQHARNMVKRTTVKTGHVIRAVPGTVKTMFVAAKVLFSAFFAVGWIAMAVIIVLCLVGLLVGSCFGIFFSGEDTGTGQSMQSVVREINEDYQSRLDAIKTENVYDVLEMSGSQAMWPEVIAVYAVKTTADPDNAMDVATMDDSRKMILKDIFWQMHEISSEVLTGTDTVITETDDGNGNIAETSSTVTRNTLRITVSHKTVEQMAEQFGFTAAQRKQLEELLANDNRGVWNQVLYGIGVGDGAIVSVALSQIGNEGGSPYWSWYGFDERVEWCACFVSWCANECGYIEAGVIPKFASCSDGMAWFRERGLWQDGGYVPRAGDIIFFDRVRNGQNGEPDHVGIVEKVEDGIVYTVEGNSGDRCRAREYSVEDGEILGYGILCS